MENAEGANTTQGIFAELTRQVIGCAIEVHRYLGPGLLESTYQQCLAHELTLADLQFRIQPSLPLAYKGVEHLSALHEAQILTYMKFAEAPVGLLINFNTILLKHGIKRFVL